MTIQEKYITSLLSDFSTFLEKSGVVQNLALLTTKNFVVFINKSQENNLGVSPNLSVQDVEKFIAAQNLPDESAILIRKFIEQYAHNEIDFCFNEFLASLKTEKRSKSTIKNYKSDIQQFIDNAGENKVYKLLQPNKVRMFVHQLLEEGLKKSTITRKLSSISQFALWAESNDIVKGVLAWISDLENLVDAPINHSSKTHVEQTQTTQEGSAKNNSLKRLLHAFLLSLEIDGHSKKTIKNYKSDIIQYLEFIDSSDFKTIFTHENVINFVSVQKNYGLKENSIKRKVSSITQFALWAESKNAVKNVSRWIHQLRTQLFDQEPGRHPQLISPTIKSGKSFAQTSPITQESTTARTSTPKKSQVKLEPNVLVHAHQPFPRKKDWSLPVPDFASQVIKDQKQNSQEKRSVFLNIKTSLKDFTQQLNAKRNKQFLPYLNLVMMIIFALGLGILGYRQFVENAPEPFAFPTSPVRPNRELSFQGRLTDTAQNPITTATNMAFRLYDTGPGTGGTLLWNSGTCSITPDQDGIFNVGLGDDCGTEITDDVFTENSNVWLEVQIVSETLTPRQSIKTVAYALNSETVQGYPVTATGAATTNTILVMDDGGHVLLGEVSPRLRSMSGTFSIEAQTLSLETTSGSNGNIFLTPNGAGAVIIRSDLDLEGYLHAPGATLSATYAGGTALVARSGPSGTANIQEWQNNAGTPLSVVDENGNIGIGTSNPTEQLTVNRLDGSVIRFNNPETALAPDDSLGTLEFYSNDPSSNATGIAAAIQAIVDVSDRHGALIFKTRTGASDPAVETVRIAHDGNVGIGTNTPGAKLDVNGNVLVAGGGTIDTRAAGTLTIGGTTQTGLTLGRAGATTTINGSGLTVGPTAWTATPTISGLITASSGVTLAANQNLTLNSGTGVYSQTFTGTTTDALTITANSLTSGSIAELSSSAVALTGNLANITLSGSNASNVRSLLSLNNTGTANANTTFMIDHRATGTNNLAVRVDDENNDTTPFVIDGAGNVGIGSLTPGYTLDVVGEFNLTDAIRVAGDAGVSGYLLTSSAGGANTWTDPSSFGGTTWWDNTANVLHPIDEYASVVDLVIGGTSTASADIQLFSNGSAVFNDQSNDSDFRVESDNNVNAFFIQGSDGNIGIGTNAPSQQLEITGNFEMPLTTATTGIIYAGTAPFIHNFGSISNTFLGINAGNLTSSGAIDNVGLGNQALDAITSGDDNVAVGHLSATDLTAGSKNTAVGTESLTELTGAGNDDNTAVGHRAFADATSGSDNTVLGSHAANLASTNNQANVFIGYDTLGWQAFADSDSNIVIGAQAGYTWATGSDNNIIIGGQAGYNTSGDGNIFLGYQSGYNETGSDKLYIENSNSSTPLIWGDFNTDDLVFYGNVEIDTGTAGGTAFIIDQDDIDQTALDIDINNTLGDIVNIDWGGATTQTGALIGLDIDLSNLTTDGTNALYGIHINDQVGNTGSAERGIFVEGTNWDYGLYVEDITYFGNNVGIGSATPGYALDVVGEFNLTDAIRVAGDAGVSGYLLTSSGGGANTWTDPTTLAGTNWWANTLNVFHPRNEYASVVDLVIGGTSTASADIQLYANGAAVFNEQGNDSDFRVEAVGAANALFVQGSDGNVGIGTNAPLSAFHMKGTQTFERAAGGVYATAYVSSSSVFNLNDTAYIGGDRLGIDTGDTTSPASKFANTTSLLSDGSVSPSVLGINWQIDDPGDYIMGIRNERASEGYGLLIQASNTTGSSLRVQNYDGSREILTALGSGNVGIGSATPGYALDVVGEFNLTDAIRVAGDAGVSGYLLTSSAGGANTWTDPSIFGGGSTWWANTLNVYHPKNEYASVVDLVIGGTSTASADIQLYSDGRAVFNEQGLDSDFRVEGVGAANALFVQGSDGYVGIGTSAPIHRLEVNSATTGKALVLLKELGNQDILTASNSAGTTRFRMANTGYMYAERFADISNDSYFLDPAGGTTSLTTAGNVGIGTTGPLSALHVTGTQTFERAAGGVYATAYISTSGVFNLNDTAYIGGDRLGIDTGDTTSPASKFANTTSLLSDGSVSPSVLGINWQIDDPSDYIMGIRNERASEGYGLLIQASNTTGSALRVQNYDGSSEILTALGNGNVGIGTSTPSTDLHVVGGARITGLVSCDTIDTDSNGVLSCGTDDGAGSSPFGSSGGVITKTTAADRLSLIYGDAGDVQLEISNVAAATAPTADVMQINLSGGSGISTDNVDGIFVNIEGADGTSADVSGIHIDFDAISGSSDDTFSGLLIDGVTGTSAVENAINIGSGWDSVLNFQGSGNVTIADNTSDAFRIRQGTDDYFVINTTNNTEVLTLDLPTGGATTQTMNFGISNIAKQINIGTGTAADEINIGTGATTANDIRIGSGAVANQIQIGSSSSTGVSITDNNWSINTSGAANFATLTGAGLTDCDSATSMLQWDSSTSLFSCGNKLSNTASFTDATNDTLNDSAQVLWDGTQPNITLTNTSDTVLVSVVIKIDSVTTNQEYDSFSIHRSTDGADADCSDTQIGQTIGLFMNSDLAFQSVSTVVLDSPSTTNQLRYAVCESTEAAGTINNEVDYIEVTLVQMGADLAENYYTTDDSIGPGDLVSLEPSLPAGVKKTTGKNDDDVIGIISTQPGITLDDGIGLNQGRPVAVALAGRVPVRVSTENGDIQPGDYLTTSSIPGVAMKATKSGKTVGKAMTGYSGDNVGSVLAFVNLTTYQPTIEISQLGDIVVEEASESGEFKVSQVSSGSVFDEIQVISQAIIGKLRAGLVTTQKLIVEQSAQIKDLAVETFTIDGLSLRDYVATIVEEVNQENSGINDLISPIDTVTDDATSSGKMATKSVIIPGKTQLGSLVTQQATVSGQLTTQELTVTNNATVSGSLLAGLLNVTHDATVAGTIHTETIKANHIVATSSRIAAIEAGMAQLEHVKATTAELMNATVSGTLYANDIYDFENKVTSTLKQPGLLGILMGTNESSVPTENLTDLYDTVNKTQSNATNSAELDLSFEELSMTSDDVVITGSALFIEKYLKVNGAGYFSDSLAVGKDLFIGESMQIADGLIKYTTADPTNQILKIQPEGQGSIELLAGIVTIDDSGKVVVNGNLEVLGDAKVDGTLLTNLISTDDFSNPLQVQIAGVNVETGELEKTKFEIVNESGTAVATIFSDGNAEFAGKADFAGGIGLDSQDLGSSDTNELTTNKTSGKATIKSGSNKVTIKSNVIDDSSLIYVTAVGSTQNKVLYVMSQAQDDPNTPTNEGEFVVGFDEVANTDVSFNWWIVN